VGAGGVEGGGVEGAGAGIHTAGAGGGGGGGGETKRGGGRTIFVNIVRLVVFVPATT
jgi:hypothetical protein